MSELSDRDLATLTSKLRLLEEELSSELDASRGSDAPVEPSEAIGRLTRMDAMQQSAMASASRRQKERRLTRVRAALAAAARDEYGQCLSCEEPIALPRLRATPEAAFCLECQSRREGR